LFAKTVGSRPFRLPDATKTVPSGSICALAYHRLLDNAVLFSVHAWPFKAGEVWDRLRYRTALNPLAIVGSRDGMPSFPPMEMKSPLGRKVPPEQNAFDYGD
jgi:hypothetical protein